MKLDYHSRTLELLEAGPLVRFAESAELTAWERENGIVLPPSYREWCKLTIGEPALRFFSNMDSFFLTSPRLREDEEFGTCVEFMRENQGNYELAIALDSSDDPPVVYSWCAGKRVRHAATFSDYVFTQIFDWQFKIEDIEAQGVAIEGITDRYDPRAGRENTIQIGSVDDLREVAALFPNRGPTTTYYVEGDRYSEDRYWGSNDQRLRLIANHTDGTTLLTLFGTEAILPVYAKIKETLAERIVKVNWE